LGSEESSSSPFRKLLIPLAKSPIKLEILPLPKKIKTRKTTTKICIRLGDIITIPFIIFN
jgi:hypothetical protein